jgi:GNAT superfamily N-acetyltransferase
MVPNFITMEEESDEFGFQVRTAEPKDVKYVYPILEEMERSARARGTGIARRTPQSICRKIYDGKAVIALTEGGDWAGFVYLEVWSGGEFVSNSGMIVNPAYRNQGVASMIKDRVFALARSRYPMAKIFSITTGAVIMKMNHRLGFEPVVYSSITRDGGFWDQCKQCVNYPILESNRREKCLCTAMVYDPLEEVVG